MSRKCLGCPETPDCQNMTGHSTALRCNVCAVRHKRHNDRARQEKKLGRKILPKKRGRE